MEVDLYEKASEAYSNWMKTSMHTVMHMGHRFAREKGLSFMQLNCLRTMKRHGKCRVNDISTKFKISTPAASQLLDRLVKSDLVVREEGRDRRVKEHFLSENGEELLQEFHSKVDKLKKSFLEGLSNEEYEDLTRVLNNMSEKLKRSFDENH